LLCAAALPLSVFSPGLLFFTKNSPFSPSLYRILARCLSTQLISTCGLSQYMQDFLTHVSFYILHSQNTIKTFIYFPFNLAKKHASVGATIGAPRLGIHTYVALRAPPAPLTLCLRQVDALEPVRRASSCSSPHTRTGHYKTCSSPGQCMLLRAPHDS
jgi:hypothetical protein